MVSRFALITSSARCFKVMALLLLVVIHSITLTYFSIHETRVSQSVMYRLLALSVINRCKYVKTLSELSSQTNFYNCHWQKELLILFNHKRACTGLCAEATPAGSNKYLMMLIYSCPRTSPTEVYRNSFQRVCSQLY